MIDESAKGWLKEVLDRCCDGPKETIVVSFSGGETSGMLCKWLIDTWGHKYNFIFMFANTGREHPETLIFADKCDKEFGLNLVWIEAIINPKKGIGVRHKIVTFETASRNGEPFEDFIAKEGIPNASRQHCTTRLKTRAMRHWMKVNGLIKCKTAIGMRIDEPQRVISKAKRDVLELIGVDADLWRIDSKTKRAALLNEISLDDYEMTNKQQSDFKSLYNYNEYNLVYPLHDWEEIDKQDVNTFWEEQSFRLNIPSHYGNCLTCFKKSDNKLFRIAHEHPEWFGWTDEMESKYGHVNAGKDDRHVFFRKKRDSKMIVGQGVTIDYNRLVYMTTSDRDKSAGCGESCEAFG